MRWKSLALEKLRAGALVHGARGHHRRSCAWPAEPLRSGGDVGVGDCESGLVGAFIRDLNATIQPRIYAETQFPASGRDFSRARPQQRSSSFRRAPAASVRHAGIGSRAPEPRLEAHQLVAAKGVIRTRSPAAHGQRRIQSLLSRRSPSNATDQVAGGDARLLRRAAFKHVRDGVSSPCARRANAEHRKPAAFFGARRALPPLSSPTRGRSSIPSCRCEHGSSGSSRVERSQSSK